MIKPKLKRIAANIYCLEFDNAYDLAMTFLRYQEFYESPKFRNKFFTISEFMEWYSKKYGEGKFTYPTDYVGYNIPSEVIKKVLRELIISEYDKWTAYDRIMYDAVKKIIHQEYPNLTFYLIGVVNPKADMVTLKHEIAHGLYSTNLGYRKKIDTELKTLSKKIQQIMREKLVGRGYAYTVVADETQAYLATGLHSTMRLDCIKKVRRPFQQIFKRYLKESIKWSKVIS